jgi:hypothetical protein
MAELCLRQPAEFINVGRLVGIIQAGQIQTLQGDQRSLRG